MHTQPVPNCPVPESPIGTIVNPPLAHTPMDTITPALQAITRGTALEGLYGEAPMNALTAPARVAYLWRIQGHGMRYGARVLITDAYIHGADEADAQAAWLAKYRGRYTALTIERTEQVVDVERPEVERLSQELEAMGNRLANLRRRVTFELPSICITVNDGWDDRCDDEDVTVPIEVAERAVMRLCDAHEAELIELATEEAAHVAA